MSASRLRRALQWYKREVSDLESVGGGWGGVDVATLDVFCRNRLSLVCKILLCFVLLQVTFNDLLLIT